MSDHVQTPGDGLPVYRRLPGTLAGYRVRRRWRPYERGLSRRKLNRLMRAIRARRRRQLNNP